MRILSIDFDYFQTVESEFLALNYPDGHDFGGEIANVMWSSHYGNEICENKEDAIMKNVSINKDELNAIKDILRDNKDNFKDAMITQSHKDIYDYIFDRIKGKKHLEIVNVDMHHDMFNDNKETVDCGNWLGKTVERHPNTEIKWVVNPISEETYGLGENFNKLLLHSVNELKGMEFDYVFLCRSDVWLPPHLDNHFNDLKDFILNELKLPTLYNYCLDADRMSSVKEMKQASYNAMKDYKKMMEKLKEIKE